MLPSNPDNQQPLIYRIADAAGVFHLVAPVDHNHTMSEVAGLESALAAKANAAAVETALAGKMDKKTIDSAPIANSTNLVTSGGVKAALDGKRNLVGQTISFVINGQEIEIESSDVPNLIRALSNPDTTPTADSNNLVTSGGVKAALDGKQDILTFDSTPTEGSTNPVTSGGVKTVLEGKQDTLTFDATPTANSTNPVTSGGVKAALDGKENIAPKLRVSCSLVEGTKILTEVNQGDIVDLISQIWDGQGTDVAYKMEIECVAQDIAAIAQCSCMYHLFTTGGYDRFAFAIVLNNDVYQVNGTVDDYQQGVGFHLDSNHLTYIDDIFNFQMDDFL